MEETIVHVVVTNLGTTEIEMEDLEEPVLEELWISVWTTVQWTPLKFLDLVSQCAPSDACKISFKELYSKKTTYNGLFCMIFKGDHVVKTSMP